jgi:tetratricopeptide (TPR) repeat protein
VNELKKSMKKISVIASFSLVLLVMTSTTLVFADTTDVHNFMNKGISALTNENFTGAITQFDQVLKIEPNNTIALDNKGVALGNLKKYHEAITQFDQVLKIEPNNTDALSNKAAALIKLGKFDEAMIYINQTLKIQPGDPVALSNKKVAIHHADLSLRLASSDLFKIFGQIEIRNSNGNLVAYLEPPDIWVPDPGLMNAALDTQSVLNDTTGPRYMMVEKSNFTDNGKQFEKINIVVTSTYGGGYTVASKTGILKGEKFLFFANHDGYQLLDGDKLIQKWEIIRPLW